MSPVVSWMCVPAAALTASPSQTSTPCQGGTRRSSSSKCSRCLTEMVMGRLASGWVGLILKGVDENNLKFNFDVCCELDKMMQK